VEASDAAAEARQLYNEGRARFDSGDYSGAIVLFRRAHELVRANRLLYNIAQAERLSGRCPEALQTYREFLAEEPSGKLRELAEARVRELGACSDATRPGKTETLAGPATVTAAGSEPEPRAPRAASARPSAKSTPTPGSEKSRQSDARGGQAAWCFGSAAVLLSVSAYFASRSQQASDRVSLAFARGERWTDELAASESHGKRDQAIALTTLAGGVLAAGVGTWLFVFD
jgi:tetratricopeptide (TPR) repeat protein